MMKPKFFRVKASIVALATIAILFGACGSSAQGSPEERDFTIRREIQLAKIDFRAQRFDSAEEHLKKALALDDNLIEARMGLAVVYSFQYIPAVESLENIATWQKAVNAFRDLLAKDPKNAIALKSLAMLNFMMQKFSEARDFYLRAISVNPDDADAYYSVGVMDWSAAYEDTAKRKPQIGLDTDTPFRNNPRDQKLCMDLRAANELRVEDGLKNLTRAMEKRQDFGDAMGYMSLLYKRKADIDCGSPSARAEDLKLSRRYADDAVAARHVGPEQDQLPAGIGPSEDDVDFGIIAESLLLVPPPPLAPLPPPPPPPVRHGSGQSGAAGNSGQGPGAPNRLHLTPAELEKNLIIRRNAVYPYLGDSDKIQGDITLRVIVGKDGNMKSVTAISGPTILRSAAIDAVKEWSYKPFLLNGEPVEAESTVTIHFPPQ
jgi:TonB family protein